MVATRMVPSKPALVIQEGERRHLVVADLHIGFESRLAANDVFIGGNSTVGETASEITGIIREEGIDSLVLLGDIKSGTGSITRAEWDDVPRFFEEVAKVADVSVVPGNHDAGIQRLIPDGVTQISTSGVVLGNTLLTHGHAMPSENFAHVGGIVMGHVHPVFFDEGSVLNGERVWVSARVRRRDLFPSAAGGRSDGVGLLLVPSFNRYLYATHRRERAGGGGRTSPIIRRIKRFESALVVTLDGSVIGDEGVLDRVL